VTCVPSGKFSPFGSLLSRVLVPANKMAFAPYQDCWPTEQRDKRNERAGWKTFRFAPSVRADARVTAPSISPKSFSSASYPPSSPRHPACRTERRCLPLPTAGIRHIQRRRRQPATARPPSAVLSHQNSRCFSYSLAPAPRNPSAAGRRPSATRRHAVSHRTRRPRPYTLAPTPFPTTSRSQVRGTTNSVVACMCSMEFSFFLLKQIRSCLYVYGGKGGCLESHRSGISCINNPSSSPCSVIPGTHDSSVITPTACGDFFLFFLGLKQIVLCMYRSGRGESWPERHFLKHLLTTWNFC